MRGVVQSWVSIVLVVVVTGPAYAQSAPPPPTLADAPLVEQQTLEALLESSSWARRAIAAARLERFSCEASRDRTIALTADDAWQVRAFAYRTLGRRRASLPEMHLDAEDHPRVMRTALRHRFHSDPERLARGARVLLRSSDFSQRMLGVELAALSSDPDLRETAREAVKKIILRMDRGEGGTLSARLSAVTGEPDLRRHYRWQNWVMTTGRRFELQPAWSIPNAERPLPPSHLARLDPERFSDLESYIETLADRRVDLAICLDTTASMSGELSEAQAGLDDMMLFAADVVAELRIGLVAYRDRRDRYETKGWDFTADIPVARERLWQLSADGGGDTPEAVYPALLFALGKLSWNPEHHKVLVLVGDAPPHVGYGTRCAELARRAYEEAELVTHAIQAEGDPVKHFDTIAEAGEGQCVTIDDDAALVPELTGLTLGDQFADEFREFFAVYLELCR